MKSPLLKNLKSIWDCQNQRSIIESTRTDCAGKLDFRIPELKNDKTPIEETVSIYLGASRGDCREMI